MLTWMVASGADRVLPWQLAEISFTNKQKAVRLMQRVLDRTATNSASGCVRKWHSRAFRQGRLADKLLEIEDDFLAYQKQHP